MKKAVRIVGWALLVIAGVLVLVGLTTLPSGGLMFALPYVFLMPGALFGVVGWVLLRLGREPTHGSSEHGSDKS